MNMKPRQQFWSLDLKGWRLKPKKLQTKSEKTKEHWASTIRRPKGKEGVYKNYFNSQTVLKDLQLATFQFYHLQIIATTIVQLHVTRSEWTSGHHELDQSDVSSIVHNVHGTSSFIQTFLLPHVNQKVHHFLVQIWSIDYETATHTNLHGRTIKYR